MTYLVLFEAVLKDVLDNQTSSLPKSHFVPHASEGLVDILHDLRRRVGPSELKQLLPNVAGVAVDDRLGDTTQEFMNHDGLVLLGNRVKGLLDNVAAKRVHGQAERVATNSLSNADDLLRRPMLEAALDQKVSEAVDHQGVRLRDNGLDDIVLLLGGSHFELLLEKDGRLLVVVANNLVNDVPLVAVDVAIEQTTVVERLRRRELHGGIRASLYVKCQHPMFASIIFPG